MNINNFLEKFQTTSNELQDFLNQLEFSLNTKQSISENDIYIIRDINNNKLSLVNSTNGKDLEIYIESTLLNNKNFKIQDLNLYDLKLGMGIKIKNNTIIPLTQEIKLENIRNSLAFSKLEDMYFCISEENGSIYSVEKIYNDKIYLTNIKSGGYFSIPFQKYSNLNIGDLVENQNGNYYKINPKN